MKTHSCMVQQVLIYMYFKYPHVFTYNLYKRNYYDNKIIVKEMNQWPSKSHSFLHVTACKYSLVSLPSLTRRGMREAETFFFACIAMKHKRKSPYRLVEKIHFPSKPVTNLTCSPNIASAIGSSFASATVRRN